MIAKFIHHHSRRSSRPFIAINCAALPEGLLESEMFGHRKGAFTGAVRDKPGLLEAAHGGTLFLDELIEMRSEEHTSELQSQSNLVCRLLLEKKNKKYQAASVYHTKMYPIDT